MGTTEKKKYHDVKNQPDCSFCGKKQTEVKAIISGPNVYICCDCVALCVSILMDEHGWTLPEMFERHSKDGVPQDLAINIKTGQKIWVDKREPKRSSDKASSSEDTKRAGRGDRDGSHKGDSERDSEEIGAQDVRGSSEESESKSTDEHGCACGHDCNVECCPEQQEQDPET